MSFYTYMHTRNDTNETFYIGKGHGKRAFWKHGRNQHWENIVNKHGYTVHLLAEWEKEADAFEKKFNFFYNFSGTEQLVGSRLTTALDEIFERITQDIFNESLAKW